MKYSSSFTYDLSVGENGEDWVSLIFNGKENIEVKTDRLAHRTGNIFIEYECRGKPSGIATSTATYWIYRVDETDSAVIVPIEKLKQVCRVAFKEGKICLGGDNNLSKGVLVPIAHLFRVTSLELKKDK